MRMVLSHRPVGRRMPGLPCATLARRRGALRTLQHRPLSPGRAKHKNRRQVVRRSCYSAPCPLPRLDRPARLCCCPRLRDQPPFPAVFRCRERGWRCSPWPALLLLPAACPGMCSLALDSGDQHRDRVNSKKRYTGEKRNGSSDSSFCYPHSHYQDGAAHKAAPEAHVAPGGYQHRGVHGHC